VPISSIDVKRIEMSWKDVRNPIVSTASGLEIADAVGQVVHSLVDEYVSRRAHA